VTGGARDLACEAQISYATTPNVRDRAKRATDDGLTPLWTTLNPAADWIGRVPWARLDRKPWDYYRDEAELPVLGGVRTLIIEECGPTGGGCPDRRRGRKCTGMHGRWEPAQVTHFDDLIVRAAYGEFLPYQDRSTRRGNWFWVLPDDLQRIRREDDTDDPDSSGQHPPELIDQDDRPLDAGCDYEPSHSRRRMKPRLSDPAQETILVALADPKRPITVPRQVASTATSSTDTPAPAYRQLMINPGTLPVEDAREDLATANLDELLTAVRARAHELEQLTFRHRTAGISGDPVRDQAADRDGRFGWDIPFSDGRVLRILMPGVELTRLHDDITAQAPCLYVNGHAWWWNDAVGFVASEGMTTRQPSRQD
jgi:hypothetical protein